MAKKKTEKKEKKPKGFLERRMERRKEATAAPPVPELPKVIPFKEPKKEPETYTDVETGQPSGVKMGDKIFFGAPKEIKKAIEQKKEKEEEAKELPISFEEQQLRAQLLEKIRQVTPTETKKPELDYEQAVKSALADTITGAGVGAVVGGLPTGGTAAIPGAVVGALAGFFKGFKSNLATQRKDIQKGEGTDVMTQQQNILKIIAGVNSGEIDVVTGAEMFQEQMTAIYEGYTQLWKVSKDDASKYLGEDGHKQLEKYETFYQEGGMRDILIIRMDNAISNPDPNRAASLMTEAANIGAVSAVGETE